MKILIKTLEQALSKIIYVNGKSQWHRLTPGTLCFHTHIRKDCADNKDILGVETISLSSSKYPGKGIMRLVQFKKDHKQAVGVELGQGGDILDLTACHEHEAFPNTMVDFLLQGKKRMEAAKKAAGEASGNRKYVYKRDDIELMAPVTNPDKVICIGMNYRDHCEEQGVPVPKEPVVFSKFSSTIVGPNDDLPYPAETQKLDWEVELAIVIGKACKCIKSSDVGEYIAGYTVAHDVSARDWQLERNGGQWLLGKTMDAFCPLGPALCTADSLPGDVNNLEISCKVNGEYKQKSSTKEMVHKPHDLVAFLSRFVTLLPGDVILTGTPPGVGVFMKPPQFLKKGDVVECSVEGIGSIRNTVV